MKMKRLLLPVALFVAFGLTSCDEDLLGGDCEKADEVVDSCDLSKAQVCSDEESEDVYYSYLGKRYDDPNDLIDVLCPNASANDKMKIRQQLSAQGKRLMGRIRASVL